MARPYRRSASIDLPAGALSNWRTAAPVTFAAIVHIPPEEGTGDWTIAVRSTTPAMVRVDWTLDDAGRQEMFFLTSAGGTHRARVHGAAVTVRAQALDGAPAGRVLATISPGTTPTTGDDDLPLLDDVQTIAVPASSGLPPFIAKGPTLPIPPWARLVTVDTAYLTSDATEVDLLTTDPRILQQGRHVVWTAAGGPIGGSFPVASLSNVQIEVQAGASTNETVRVIWGLAG